MRSQYTHTHTQSNIMLSMGEKNNGTKGKKKYNVPCYKGNFFFEILLKKTRNRGNSAEAKYNRLEATCEAT